MSDSDAQRILIIDDEPSLFGPMQHALRQAGMVAEFHGSFPSLADRLHDTTNDDLAAVLVDMHFAGGTADPDGGPPPAVGPSAGLGVVRALVDAALVQGRNRRVPIFLMSALQVSSEHLGEVEALSARYGADIQFVTKGSIHAQLLSGKLTQSGDTELLSVDGLVDIDGKPLRRSCAGHRLIPRNVQQINSSLLEAIRRHPELMRALSPRKFEEFVAHLLDDMGYQVELTPASKDGGFDIFAAKRDGVGKFLYLVECKAYAEHHPVRVGVVRALNGVVSQRHASAGMVATTSYFTRGARELETSLPYRLSLNDFEAVRRWLDQYWHKRLPSR